jgi:putative acetyltransferase
VDIRPAALGELDGIYALHAAAFAASAYGHHGEADLVLALHAEGDALVSLGAWDDGVLIGHVLFSPMTVDADVTLISTVALAPIAVAMSHRRQGVAAALIHAGHDALKAQVRLSFVLGDPAYYGRFGYDVQRAAPFASPYAGPHFMACPLDSVVPTPQRGVAIHAPAFARLA